jgi:hypothetical protein
MIGNCAYICKPHTELTREWYETQASVLDSKLEQLKLHPASDPRDGYVGVPTEYPIRWEEILGEIFHHVIFKYRPNLLQTVPQCVMYDYL